MKKTLIYSFLMVCSGMLASCNSDTYNEPAVYGPDATITAKLGSTAISDTIRVPGVGDVYTISVETTGVEWNAYTNEDWLKVTADGTSQQSGTVTVTVPESRTAKEKVGNVIIMSGTTRLALPIKQAKGNPFDAPEGYELVWNDEFDEGTELNAAHWTHEVWGKGTVNDEQQYYVNHVSPGGQPVTEVKNGKLHINCFKEDGKVYSGRVYAHVSEGWTYGYIEASIKLPKGKGTWPAFWMMPVNFRSWPADGEIDIMEEVGGHPNFVSSSLHANGHVHTNGTQVTHEMYLAGAEDDFHTYAIEWTSGNITTYVDGEVQLSYDNTGKGRDDWPYDDPFYVIFNLAWGGTWGGTYGIDESALPVTMEVDYIRVFQK